MAQAIQEKTKMTGRKGATTMETKINAPIEAVFDFVAAEDVLPKVLTGYGLLPAVVRTSGNTGPWDKPGSSRTVHLVDKTTAREEVTDYKRPAMLLRKRERAPAYFNARQGNQSTSSVTERLLRIETNAKEDARFRQ